MWLLNRKNRPYLEADRLADVIALIQILALHGYRHRTEDGISEDAAGPDPSKWKKIAKQHPEFFRVDDAKKFGVSLIARHVLPKDDTGKRELPDGFVNMLIQTAITLHDRQQESARLWRLYLPPLIGAIVGGAFAVGGLLFKAWLDSCKP